MRKISILLLIVIIFNFIGSNFYSVTYATDEIEGQEAIYDKEAFDKLTNEGIVNLNGSDEKLTVSTSSTGSFSGIMSSLCSSVFLIFSALMTQLANDGGFYRTESDFGAYENFWFTISSLVFGEYLLFDSKIYRTTQSLNSSITQTDISKLMDDIKTNAMGWFELLRTFALGLFLALLIYGAARLLGATLADERARWKKILVTWFIAIIFVFFIPYIVILIDIIIEIIMEILWTVRLKLEGAGYQSFEIVLFTTIMKNLANVGGMKAFAYGLEYAAFVVFQLIFFGKYFIRTFKIILLVVISPVIAVLHTFNIMSGNDNNILKDWFVQYIMNIILQPLHALIYIIFIFTVSEIAINAPLLGLVFLWALLRAEKILKVMLNIDVGKISSLFGSKK